MSVFATLHAINVNGHVEQKNGLNYLSWAWAWAEVKKAYPAAYYTVYEDREGRCYHTDGKTCWVKTGVTIEGLEHIEYLPVMDHRNRSIPWEAVTSFDVNKAIQRSLTKACARHGLGLYLYAGEDMPEEAKDPSTGTSEVPITAVHAQVIEEMASSLGVDMAAMLRHYGVDTIGQMSDRQACDALRVLGKRQEGQHADQV